MDRGRTGHFAAMCCVRDAPFWSTYALSTSLPQLRHQVPPSKMDYRTNQHDCVDADRSLF